MESHRMEISALIMPNHKSRLIKEREWTKTKFNADTEAFCEDGENQAIRVTRPAQRQVC